MDDPLKEAMERLRVATTAGDAMRLGLAGKAVLAAYDATADETVQVPKAEWDALVTAVSYGSGADAATEAMSAAILASSAGRHAQWAARTATPDPAPPR